MFTPDKIVDVITFYIPFLFALCFHEYAHGWTAKKLGDNTADIMGRLTLNPMAHIDWVGTVVLPIMAILVPGVPLFGWAKPVPVNSRNLEKPRNGMFWIALAGPLSNVLLFIAGLLFLAVLVNQSQFVPSMQMNKMIYTFLALNLYLAFFNLLPIHPLDGGKVFARFLPLKWDLWLEKQQDTMQWILLLLVIFGGLRILALPVDWVLDNSIALVESLQVNR
jgi:Zn-dependent protease